MVRVHSGPPLIALDGHHLLGRGISSAGRAPALHAGGQRFDPAILHHFKSSEPVLLTEVLIRVFGPVHLQLIVNS